MDFCSYFPRVAIIVPSVGKKRPSWQTNPETRNGVRPGVFSLCWSRPMCSIPFSFPFRSERCPANPGRLPARLLGYPATNGRDSEPFSLLAT
jgi:hypothetical protein